MAHLLIDREDSLLLVVDVQAKLWPHISNQEQVRDRCALLIRGAAKLEVPIVVSEQYPKGLGPTLPELRQALPPGTLVREKMAFGCLGETEMIGQLEALGRGTLVVCGIEAHVCVLQTVLGALGKGLRAVVVADAIGSRVESNRALALERMRGAGATVVSAEMLLFEWMRTAKHPAFKEISALVK